MATSRHWLCGLSVIIVYLYLILIGYYSDSPSLRRMCMPMPSQPPQNTSKEIKRIFKKSPNPHDYFNRDCYHYEDLKAIFICDGPYFNFTKERIFDCAWKLWNASRNSKEVDPWQGEETPHTKASPSDVRNRPAINITIVGDSHMRYIFEVFAKRMVNPDIRYRIASFKKDQWKDIYGLLSKHKWNVHEAYQEVIHLSVPLRITYKWDRKLKSLPSLLKKWNAGKEPRPTFLIFATGLHYVIKSESKQYANHLKVLAPLVREFAKTTPSVFKLMDHVQTNPNDVHVNNRYIDRYNDIARKTLAGDHLVLWDSAQPLSDLYNEECRKHPRITPETFLWICDDTRHIGYIMNEQYRDMYLNAICNKVGD